MPLLLNLDLHKLLFTGKPACIHFLKGIYARSLLGIRIFFNVDPIRPFMLMRIRIKLQVHKIVILFN